MNKEHLQTESPSEGDQEKNKQDVKQLSESFKDDLGIAGAKYVFDKGSPSIRR